MPGRREAGDIVAKRGRKSGEQRGVEVVASLRHLHDLDWLDECSLARHQAVKKVVNPTCLMAEGQALRKLLLWAVDQTISGLEGIPGYEGVVAFLEGYKRGESVSRIARRMKIRRENLFRTHRPKAFMLVTRNFLELLAKIENSEELAVNYPEWWDNKGCRDGVRDPLPFPSARASP